MPDKIEPKKRPRLSANPKKRPRPSAVAPVTPPVLIERDAAPYIGKSPSWMRQRRFRDIALARLGKEPDGPAWIQVESSIMYEVTALDEWLSAHRIERGQIEFRGKAKASMLEPTEEQENPNSALNCAERARIAAEEAHISAEEARIAAEAEGGEYPEYPEAEPLGTDE